MFKVVLWLGIALVIDFAFDPLWSSFVMSVYGPTFFARWNPTVYFAYFHFLPYAISNAMEGLIYGLLKGVGIL